MVHSDVSKGMTYHQTLLVEHALRLVSRIEEDGWEEIPPELHTSFAKYMCPDFWTGRPDLLTLRQAALMIVRDAITHTGEFQVEE